MIAPVRPPDPWHPTPMAIRGVRRETADTVTLTLDPGVNGWAFTPGQFNMLYLPGLGEVAISICGDPSRPDELVHTIRAVGSVTRPLCQLEPGDWVGVRGPYGRGWPVDAAVGADVVVVAGGVGLAPLRPVIYELLARRDAFNRVIILYGARQPDAMLYEPQLRQWRGRFDTDVRVTVDRAGGGWRGPVGVVTRLVEQAPFDPDDTVVFTCGPEIMMRFVAKELQEEGVGADQIWVSMERSMKCGIGLCGHCQWGGRFVCRDGPVFRFDRVAHLFSIREV